MHRLNRKFTGILLSIISICASLYYLFFFRTLQNATDTLVYQYNFKDKLYLSTFDVAKLVSNTNGFYVRDWSLWLGWNNVRYIIEASLLHARILNRTLVLPSFIYARACEFDPNVCSSFFDAVERKDIFKNYIWPGSQLTPRPGWRVPIMAMIDLPSLRKYQPVILVSDYLKLHNISELLEKADGSWDRDGYHMEENILTNEKPSLFVIQNEWYDPHGVLRVDHIPDNMKIRGKWNPSRTNTSAGQIGAWDKISDATGIFQILFSHMGEGKSVIDWSDVSVILRGEADVRTFAEDNNGKRASRTSRLFLDTYSDNDGDLQRKIETAGWEVLYTYLSTGGTDFSKTVTRPSRQIAPRVLLRGLEDDFKLMTEDVILLEGETHLDRKPGNMRFTTSAARDEFTRMVLHAFRAPSPILQLASIFDARMREKVGGRSWMGAHMRRTDFLNYGWAPSSDIATHFQKVHNKLKAGRQILIDINTRNDSETYDVPDAISYSSPTYPYPEEGDPFFLATDERDPADLKYMTDRGAVLISDLFTVNERRFLGLELLLTDVLALIEQALLSRAAYFYANALSSLAGGVINTRAAQGADPRTSLIE